ncbi:MAG: anti-sigma factor [Terriglobales bacterium]
MNCAEFQRLLPNIIENGGNAEEEAHLRSCPMCSDLVQDLRYIAEAAKLLLPMQDPSPRVWSGIRGALEREGLVRPPAGTVRFRPPAATVLSPRRWATGGTLLAFAAMLLFAIGVLWFRNSGARQAAPTLTASVPAPVTAGVPSTVPVDEDDAQVLSMVQQKSPAMLSTYRENLEAVNAYIRDARRIVEQDPTDMGAHGHLIRAYDQKALLYEMAMYRSGE